MTSPVADALCEHGREPWSAAMSGVSASCLLFLGANRVVGAERDKWKRAAWGTFVPCTEIEVNAFTLAPLLFASAFWGLQTGGLIDLELIVPATDEHNRRWPRLLARERRRIPDVVAHIVRIEPKLWLEGAAIEGLNVGETVDVVSQIEWWLGEPAPDALMTVIMAVVDEATTRGLFCPSERPPERRSSGRGSSERLGFLARRRRHWRSRKMVSRRSHHWINGDGTILEPRCDRIAALEADLQTTLAQWNEFAATQSDLHRSLMHACLTAISTRQTTRYVPTGGDGG
jgi:hypothetical protein